MTTYISIDISLNTISSAFLLPLQSFSGTIDWGDGSSDVYSGITNPSHTYSSLSTYTIQLIDVINLSWYGYNADILTNYKNSIISFNYLSKIDSLISFYYAFRNCIYLTTFNIGNKSFTNNVTTMEGMFYGASNFNSPIEFDCDVCLSLMLFLRDAVSFNSNIILNNTYNVTTMQYMFNGAYKFNQSISFDCSNCTNLDTMFTFCYALNSPINLYNTTKVETIRNMFFDDASFNQPLTLDCSSCTDMTSFLKGAKSFNRSIQLTNTSKVKYMNYMFYGTESFNQNISLDCSSCTQIKSFLYGATSFDSSINLTPIPSLTDATNMLVNTNLSVENYSNLLILWGNQTALSNVPLGANGLMYDYEAIIPRNNLTSKGWTITDDGLDISPPTITSITPNYGPTNYSNQLVTIVGTNLNNNTVVTFDGSNSTIETISYTSITCYVPLRTVSNQVDMIITNNYGDVSTTFDYVNTNIMIDISLNTISSAFTLPISDFSGTVIWGDGYTNTYNNEQPSHSYASLSTYTIQLVDVTNLSWYGYNVDSLKNYKNSITSFSYLTKIDSLTSFNNAFVYCNKLTTFYVSNPDFTNNVTDMGGMFKYASKINSPISLNCSSCTNLESFLLIALSFDSDLNLTNTNKVTTMSSFLEYAIKFNKNINLDCTSCTNLNGFLGDAVLFDSSINLTNTYNVTNVSGFLSGCTNFNQPISLDCASCTNLSFFLNNAQSFDSSLNLTNIGNLENAYGMLINTNLSVENYSNLLILWGNQTVKSRVNLDANGLMYDALAITPRSNLTSKSWSITDGGLDPLSPIITSISPSYGNINVSTIIVTITGTNLSAITSLTFGGVSSTIISLSDTILSCYAPSSSTEGTVTVIVSSNNGRASTTYTYVRLYTDMGYFWST